MKTIPVRSSYLRILAIRYQGARKDRLLLNVRFFIVDSQYLMQQVWFRTYGSKRCGGLMKIWWALDSFA